MTGVQMHGATVRLVPDRLHSWHWLAEALAPYAELLSAPEMAVPTVRIVAQAPARPVIEADGWPTTSGVSVGLDPSGEEVHVHADLAQASHRLAVLQLVRGLLVDRLLRSATPLHAAAVSTSGVGVVLAGAKGAGKTSFTTALLRASPSGHLVTNDKGVVVDGVVHGLPFAVLIGEEGLRRTPELRSQGHRQAADKSALWPSQFAAAFGHGLAASVRPTIGIWCDAQFDTQGLTLRRMGRQEVGAEVESALTAFSTAMVPTHVADSLHRDLPPRGGIPLPECWRSMTWFHARGNPWHLGSDHLALLAGAR